MFKMDEQGFGLLLESAEEEEVCRVDSEDEEYFMFRSPLMSSDVPPPAKRRKLQVERNESLTLNSSSSPPENNSVLSSTQDHKRTIIHIDIDCFYAQVEMIRNPELRDKPLGVKQKYLIVTCNYVARRSGVTKLMGIKEALKRCPDLVIVNGENLTHYREFSQRVNELARRYSPSVERLGMDENYIDVTDMVQSRLSSQEPKKTLKVSGYLYVKENADITDSQLQVKEESESCSCGCHERLTIGSLIAAEIRDAICKEISLTSCAGVGHSKLLAKLVGEVHKPNMQTTIFPEQAEEFLSSLRIRKIPGVGHTMANSLKGLGIESVKQLKSCSFGVLESQFGKATAVQLYRLCRGVDDSEVIFSGNPKSISNEDSFNKCDTVIDAKRRLGVLVKNLLPRLKSDLGKPGTIRLSIRKWEGVHSYKRESRQCPVPGLFHTADENQKAKLLLDNVLALFYKLVNIEKSFHITLFNVCLTNFHSSEKQESNVITKFFTKANMRQCSENKVEMGNKGSANSVAESKEILLHGDELQVEPKQSEYCTLQMDVKSTPSMFTQHTLKETPPESKKSITTDRPKLEPPVSPKQNQAVNNEIQTKLLPFGIDVGVFHELPREVQKELLDHWSHSKHDVAHTDNQFSNKDLKPNNKHGLFKYFEIV